MEPQKKAPGKGDSFWKPSFSGSMLNFEVYMQCFFSCFIHALVFVSRRMSEPSAVPPPLEGLHL